MENFKPRDQLKDKSGRDSKELRQAAKVADQGPTFGTPGDPPDADPNSIDKIEKSAKQTPRHG